MGELKLILGFLILVVNIISFILVGYDKRKAKINGWRVPEKRFFTLALFGGAIGVYLGMKYFRHKTRHSLFVYGIPLMILLNFAIVYLIDKFLR